MRDQASTTFKFETRNPKFETISKCRQENQKVPNKLGGTSSEWEERRFAFQVSGVRFQGFGFGASDFGILFVFVSDFDIRISDFESLMSCAISGPRAKRSAPIAEAR